MANQAVGTYQLAEIPPATIHWIWPGRIARGAITILESDPGTGKGLIAMDIAARITRGAPFPGDSDSAIEAVENEKDPDSGQPKIQNLKSKIGNVLLASTEDSATVTLRARAEAAGADLDN